MLDTESIKRANLFRVVYIALCFLVLFTAYISAQNLVAQIYTQLGYGSLGQICLFLVFGFMGTTSMVASHYKKKMSVKAGLMFGACCEMSLIFAGAFTTFCDKYQIEGGLCQRSSIFAINCIGSIFVGIGAAFIWLSQAVYVNECADEKTRGLFNGVFWSIFQTAQIISGTLATLILGSADQFTFYLVLLIFCAVSLVMFSFIKEPVSYGPKEEAVQNDQTLQEAVTVFGKTIGEKKYHVLYSGLFFSGVAIGCYISFMGTVVTHIVNSDNVNFVNSRLGLVLLILAIGEVSAGLSAGRLADMYDKLKLFNITLIINEVALLVTFLALVAQSYPCALLAGFLWGYGDTSINTLINAVIGSVFGGKVELFSTYRFFQGFGNMYSAIFSVMLPTKSVPLLYIMFIAASMMILHVLFHRNLPKASSNRNSEYLLADEKKMMVEMKNIV